MSRKERKARRKVQEEARRLTPGKVGRLLLKSFLFALVVGTLLTVTTAFGVPYSDRTWVQFAFIFALYLLFYRWLLSDFRVKQTRSRGQR